MIVKLMPIVTVTIVDRSVGKIMSAGLALPAEARRPITVDGKSWIDVAFITTSIIAWGLAIAPLVSSAFKAFIPIGVAAFPRPSMFADILRAIIFSISGLSILKSFLIIGRKSFASLSPSPEASTSSKTPSQTA